MQEGAGQLRLEGVQVPSEGVEVRGGLLAMVCLLSGCASQVPGKPPLSVQEARPTMGVTQVGYGHEAVFALCATCPGPTPKTLAPAPITVALPERPALTSPAPKEVRITHSVRFPLASARLTKDARQSLEALLPQLREAKSITITGHTDRVGSKAFNRRLAMHRAAAVKRALMSLGIPQEQIALVRGVCCVDDPPPVNPPARRADLELVVAKESHER